jgi:hypothetical protein
MHHRSILPSALLLLALASTAHAASDPYDFADDSSPALMSRDEAIAIWRSNVNDTQRERIRKLYPVSKWGFVSQVEGGFAADKICVVTARVMMVPRSTGGRLLFKPTKSATTFAAQPGATVEQCRATAKEKLQEAVYALITSLIVP